MSTKRTTQRAERPPTRRSADREYARALREAGVSSNDLTLLRDLADANAHELQPAARDRVRPTRVFL
jgi:hypothetical protein